MKANGPLPIILAPILYIIFIPIGCVIFFLNEVVRLIVQLILQIKHKGQITLVSDGNDGIWGGYGGPGTIRNVLVAGFLKKTGSPLTHEKCAKEFQEKVLDYQDGNGNRPYEKFEKILVVSFGYTCWKICEKFNVNSHFRFIQPEKVHSKNDVQEILSQLVQDMQEDKPQWEFVIIPRYKENADAEEKSLHIIRFQHAYMDGLSLVSMLKMHLAENFEYSIDPLKFSIPVWKRIFFYINYVLYMPYFLVLLLWTKFKDAHWVKTDLASGKRNLTWTKEIDMEIIRKIRTETRSTVTNVVSTAFVLAAKKILPSARLLDEIVIGEIVAMLPYKDTNPQNRFTAFSYSIPTKTEDPLDKVRRTKIDSLEGLIGPQTLLYYLTFKFLGRFPPVALSVFFAGVYESLFLSNVPASTTKFKILGSEVEEFAAWPPQPNNTGICMASLSYANTIKLCGQADESWLTKEELESIFREMPRIIYTMANMDYPEDSTTADIITENENSENTEDDSLVDDRNDSEEDYNEKLDDPTSEEEE